MLSGFVDFFNAVKEARFTFDVIWDAVRNLFADMLSNPDVGAVIDGFLNGIEPIFNIALIVGIVLALVVAFFGRKIIGVIKFVAFFALGFLLGAHLLTPLLPPEIALPGWLIGIITALIAGVLSKFVYVVVYAVIAGYAVYGFTYYGFLLTPEPAYSNTRALVALGVSVVCVVILFVIKKYIEMLGTAILGSWLAAIAFAGVYDFTALPIFAGHEWLGTLILTALLSIISFFVQVKTRRRY